jgi:hypothetical protein
MPAGRDVKADVVLYDDHPVALLAREVRTAEILPRRVFKRPFWKRGAVGRFFGGKR